VVQNGRVTQYDDREQPSPSGDDTAPDGDSGAWDDTQPISQAEPETPTGTPTETPTEALTAPVAPEEPRPEDTRPEDTRVWPTPGHDAGYAPIWEQQAFGHEPEPRGSVTSAGTGQPPWFWPVVAAVALVVGLLGGTLASVAVFRSLDGTGPVSVPVVESDEQAAKPLAADNGSIAAVAEQLLPSTVQVLAGGGGGGGGGATGSGFVLDSKGHVITNNHVVADATGEGELKVVDHEGQEHDASIVGRSPVYDVAVLQVEGLEDLRPAALGSSRAMRIGESVVAIGSPLGLSSTVTTGIVSALDRPVTTGSDDESSSYINAVQTDAAINPGNSGGPLVNLRGQVVGVNSAIATTGGPFGSESGNIGVGFAIPMEQVKVTAAQILSTGEAKYPVIGANVNTGDRRGGAEVVDVPAGTPAAVAGLEEGDIVTAVDDKKVNDGIGLIVAIRSHQPGETIRLTVLRDGDEVEVDVTLDAKVG
jgi:putative serine protease PepD